MCLLFMYIVSPALCPPERSRALPIRRGCAYHRQSASKPGRTGRALGLSPLPPPPLCTFQCHACKGKSKVERHHAHDGYAPWELALLLMADDFPTRTRKAEQVIAR